MTFILLSTIALLTASSIMLSARLSEKLIQKSNEEMKVRISEVMNNDPSNSNTPLNVLERSRLHFFAPPNK